MGARAPRFKKTTADCRGLAIVPQIMLRCFKGRRIVPPLRSQEDDAQAQMSRREQHEEQLLLVAKGKTASRP